MGLNDTPWFSMGLDRFDTLLEGGSLTGFRLESYEWNAKVGTGKARNIGLGFRV